MNQLPVAETFTFADENGVSLSGADNQGKPDEQSGLFAMPNDIQYLSLSDVALLKGELWQDNESAGQVHRSPQLARYSPLSAHA